MRPAALNGFLADVIFTHHTAVRVVSTAAATSVSPPRSKGMLPWRVGSHYRRSLARPYDRLVYSLYFPPHDVLIIPSGWMASGGVGVRRSDRYKAKWTYSTGYCRSNSKAAVQTEHQLNLARQIVEMATRIDRRFLATSNPLQYPTFQDEKVKNLLSPEAICED